MDSRRKMSRRHSHKKAQNVQRLRKIICAFLWPSLLLRTSRRTVVSLVFCLTVVHMESQDSRRDYKNANLPVERRVANLLSLMTLEEKVAQLTCLWERRPQVGPQTDYSTDRGDFDPAKAAEVMKYGIGQIARQRERKGPREGAMFANAVQRWLVENTRLGIPAIFHDEILHGNMAQGKIGRAHV